MGDLHIVEAKAGKWRAIEAVKAQCRAQTSDVIEIATRAQVEAQQRIEQVQAQAYGRVEMERKRAHEVHLSLLGGVPEACNCGTIFIAGAAFCHKCGQPKEGAQAAVTPCTGAIAA